MPDCQGGLCAREHDRPEGARRRQHRRAGAPPDALFCFRAPLIIWAFSSFGLGWLLFRIHDCLDQRLLRGIQRSADGGANFVGTLATECIRATRFGESHEIDRRQIAAIFRQNRVVPFVRSL
jgi:hypothetical protein